MRENFKGNKKRREESKRKKKEEKRNKRLNRKLGETAGPEMTSPVLPELPQ